MTLALRTVTAVACATVIGTLAVPSTAEAQRRRAVPVVRSRPAVSVGVYYGPRIYRSYRSPYALYPPYYYSQIYPPYGYGYGGLYDVSGSLRLEVRPRETQVFVDGYYAGVVDEFDGIFQRLRVEAGDHDIQLYLPGHRSFSQPVYLQPGRTFSIRHVMQPLGPGDPEAVPPSGSSRRTGPSPDDRAQGPRPIGPRGRDAGRDREPVRDRERDREEDRGRQRDRATVGRTDFGTLAVRVQPDDAQITIDGEAWEGPEDGERLTVQLGVGVHTVQIRRNGYRAYITDITVRPDDTTTLNVALTEN